MGNPTPSSGAHHPIAAVPHPFPAVSASGALPSKVQADTGCADRKERPETGEAARFEALRARLIRLQPTHPARGCMADWLRWRTSKGVHST
jgi:hypothetical protein